MMADFLPGLSLFSLALTFGAFQVGLWCQKKTKSPICNPILIGAALVIIVLLLTGIDPETYTKGTTGLSWLLTPATICLAVPMHRQLKALKKNLPTIFVGVFAGTITSLAVVFGLCRLLTLDRTIAVSLLPKSITTAIGMVLSEENGGIASLTNVVILLTGIIGNLMGTTFCKLFRLSDPVSRGVALGTASHLIGTAKATEIDPLTGAVSSLSLVIAGILTVLLFPLVCNFV